MRTGIYQEEKTSKEELTGRKMNTQWAATLANRVEGPTRCQTPKIGKRKKTIEEKLTDLIATPETSKHYDRLTSSTPEKQKQRTDI